MTTYIKVNQAASNFPKIEILTQGHLKRVSEDGGVVENVDFVRSLYAKILESGVKKNNVLYCGGAEAGYKLSGGEVVKAYSIYGDGGDLVQASPGVTLEDVSGETTFAFSDGIMVSESSTVGVEATLRIDFKSKANYLRRVARIDSSSSPFLYNGNILNLDCGALDGYLANGQKSGTEGAVLFEEYEDFNNIAIVANLNYSPEIYVNGEIVRSGAGIRGLPSNNQKYFKLGGNASNFNFKYALAQTNTMSDAQLAIV